MFVVVCFVPVSLFTVLASVVDWNLTVTKGPIQVKSSSSMAVYSAWHTPVYLLYTMMMLKSMLSAWMFLVCLIFFFAFSAICFSHIHCLFWSFGMFRAFLLLLFFHDFCCCCCLNGDDVCTHTLRFWCVRFLAKANAIFLVLYLTLELICSHSEMFRYSKQRTFMTHWINVHGTSSLCECFASILGSFKSIFVDIHSLLCVCFFSLFKMRQDKTRQDKTRHNHYNLTIFFLKDKERG